MFRSVNWWANCGRELTVKLSYGQLVETAFKQVCGISPEYAVSY